jgi:hypothetical protein
MTDRLTVIRGYIHDFDIVINCNIRFIFEGNNVE